MNTDNFAPMLNKALRNKAEVIYCIDEWIELLEKSETEIALCSKANEILLSRMRSFRRMLLAGNIPTLTAPNEEYVVDIFEDCIQLGLETWSEDAEFDETGFHTQGDSKYELMAKVTIPYISLEQWAKTNDVKPGTASQWVKRKRLMTRKDGRDLKVSAIQYVPDALFNAKKRSFRFKHVGVLPEGVVQDFPFLADNILELLFSGKEDNNLLVVSIKEENGEKKGAVNTYTLSERERRTLIYRLLELDSVRCVSEQYYQSPLPEATWAGKKRFPVIVPSKEVMKAYCGFDVRSKCNGALRGGKSPSFEMVRDNGDYIKGNIATLYDNPQRRLLKAIFGVSSEDEIVEGLANAADVNLKAEYPWDKRVLLVTDMKVTPDEDGNTPMLQGLRFYASKMLGAQTTMTAFALPKNSPETETNAKYITKSGYKEIDTDKACEWKNRLFFAYTEL